MSLRSCLSCSYHLGLSGLVILAGEIGIEGGDRTYAQEVTADPSLGTKVELTDGKNYQITGGTTVGNTNLFHSFSNFSVKNQEIVNFHSASGINNILVRVTGANPSDIQGTLQAQANLFLINPKGIIFGKNAKLNLGGSFIGTTASAIQFSGGAEFSMTSPVNPLNPLLSVNPSAFLFNQIASEPISPIQVNTGPIALSVPASRSLVLLGGDVNLEGATLQAPNGRIELGGLAGTGTVGLNIDNNNFRLSFPDNVARANVSLTQTTTVTVSGQGSGAIQIQGKRVTLADDSAITVNTVGSKSGATLLVKASESVKLLGGSYLLSDTVASGNAGEVKIETGQLIVQDGAYISASALSQGNGGKLSVTATDSIKLIGTSRQGNPSGLFAFTQGIGKAGELRIETRQLIVQDGASISASRFRESTTKGGSIIIKAEELNVLNGADITVSSLGTNQAGDLEITARSINLDNKGKLSGRANSGDGGNIKLNLQKLLSLRRNSEISTNARGNGGNIIINARSGLIVAIPRENSDITANASQGKGGRVDIRTSGIYGIQRRQNRTDFSDITATGGSPELNGTVEINTPDIDLNSGLINLPTISPAPEIAQACNSSSSAQSKFVVIGRGGLPPNPNAPLNNDAVWMDLDTPISGENNPPTTTSFPNPIKVSPPTQIVEATEWATNDKGEVVLTASTLTTTPHNPALISAKCHVP
ncbi:MAG: filamentous hemagglutinin N-terminal domain-containing protein [Nostoc sp. ChiSLP02]|nr:filamentous hemagglutinin N-terminal domain-containing protein [Nostoc sp. DedSLP05]MDZ8100997.1 filamentous hemagglutinin N-terminal domain-containing protein [Nostoc sp. DedSLP01]MDZ8188451.1 filamentous hemagglutinin N-terminal domain-containing protein [Nostoc sp. ChiSLP02]